MKSYQIVMEQNQHRQLKERAKLMNLNIGVLIGNMLSSLECRLARQYRDCDMPDTLKSQSTDLAGIRILLNADAESLSDADVSSAFELLCQETRDQNVTKILWKPAFDLGDEP